MEMEMIFLNVFNRSLAAGWLILAVIVVRFLLKKAPRRLSCVLWAVVAVRLLCPFFPASSFRPVPNGGAVNAGAVRFLPAPALDSGRLFLTSPGPPGREKNCIAAFAFKKKKNNTPRC